MTGEDKKLQKLLKGNFEEPTPSPSFTSTVMNKIAPKKEVDKLKESEYIPIIPKVGWVIIGGPLLSIIILVLVGEVETQSSLTNYIPKWYLDHAVFDDRRILISLLCILLMLIIDQLIIRFRLVK